MSALPNGIPVGDVVGASVPQLASGEKVQGRAYYTDDLTRPGMLHGAVLGSIYPHARIISCDITAAAALPGVRAVITCADFSAERHGAFFKDQYSLARDKVRYLGEPVAAVAATDLATAQQAVRLIDVEYEELEAVYDPIAAMQPGAPVIHEERLNYGGQYAAPAEENAISYTAYQEGDVGAAWAQCDVIAEDEYWLPSQEHMYLEPVSTLAEIDNRGKLTVWSSMQGVVRMQSLLADVLAMPMSKVRVIAPAIGGAFGGKGDLTNQALVGALSRAAGAPVKITLTRDQDMTTTKRRHGGRIRMKTGAKRDGILIARSAEIILDGGAYADESPAVLGYAAYFARGPYNIPNFEVRAWSVYTNCSIAGSFRGFGNPQATFAGECQIDQVAEQLGIDPIELRLKNALATGDPWVGGDPVAVGSVATCLERVREASDWQRLCAQSGTVRAGRRRGIGVAALAHTCSFLSAGATVRLNEDGTITLNTAAQDIGQGSDTALAQIAAGSLGLALDNVNFATPDSDLSPYDFLTAGSRVTYTVGVAVRHACEQVREKIFAHASEMLECAKEDLELRPGGVVGMAGVPSAQLPFAAIAGRATFGVGGPISATHEWLFPGRPFDPKRTIVDGFNMPASIGIHTFGAQVAEVEVDEVTGKVELLQLWAVHDVGRAINPVAVEGQIHGAVVQGIGYATIEELVWEEGRLANPTMMDYKVPGMADTPYAIHPIIVEEPEPTAPFGAKGVAEIGICGPAPAISNAIKNATGVRLNQIPATPERVLRALAEREANASSSND